MKISKNFLLQNARNDYDLSYEAVCGRRHIRTFEEKIDGRSLFRITSYFIHKNIPILLHSSFCKRFCAFDVILEATKILSVKYAIKKC